MSDTDAAKELGIGMVTFYKLRLRFEIPSFFQRTGLRKRKSGEIYSFKDYNERFFEKIDSIDKAYFLGLLASDGNISPRLTAVRIALKEEDAEILEYFRQCLGKDAPELKVKIPTIKGRLNKPQRVLCLSRIAMVQDLMKHGIEPCKSHSLELRCDIRDDLKPHFLRGVWDGDGSVTERRFKVTTGSLAFAYQLRQMIKDVSDCTLSITEEKTVTENKLFCICGYICHAKAIHPIYGVEGPALARKRANYLRYWDSRR